MAIGKVKSFNNEKKCGFIQVKKRDFSVNLSSAPAEGYQALKRGQIVECDVVSGPTGERLINVKNW